MLAEVETLKAQRNRASKEIGALMGQKKTAEAEAKKAETRELGDRITVLDKEAEAVEVSRNLLMLQLPNLPHESVKIGKTAEDNPVVRVHGEKAAFAFKPKSHVELCESLKLVDFARATKLSGSGFLLYTNWGARLERALIQMLLDLHTGEHGYTEVSPPFVVGPQCLEGVGQFPKFKDQYYGVVEGDKTAEWGNYIWCRPPRRPWRTFIARKFSRKASCRFIIALTRRVFAARRVRPALARAA